MDVERVKELRDSGKGASVIAKEPGIGRASLYRALGVGLKCYIGKWNKNLKCLNK